jgi:hypothetical protein
MNIIVEFMDYICFHIFMDYYYQLMIQESIHIIHRVYPIEQVLFKIFFI